MDMRHTIRGDTQGIIGRTITSFTINHTMPMSMAIIPRTAPMAITIARTMATIIVVTIATVMATDERTIAQTCGVMARAHTGDIDGQVRFHGRGPDTRRSQVSHAPYVTGAFSDRDQATTAGLACLRVDAICGSNAMGCLPSIHLHRRVAGPPLTFVMLQWLFTAPAPGRAAS
jgi:hypothetical protein